MRVTSFRANAATASGQPALSRARACRRSAVCCLPPASRANWKVLNGPCVINLVGKRKCNIPVTYQPNPEATLQNFMSTAGETISNISLPLGGKITRVTSNRFNVLVPKIELFGIWLQPYATARVQVLQDQAVVTCGTGDCVLQGSSHVQRMALNDRYNVDARITFEWDEGSAKQRPRLFITGSIQVEVDIPAPFSLMPVPVVKAVGDAAVASILSAFMSTAMEKLAQDYNSWAQQVSA